MTLLIKINMDNAAFEEDAHAEAARILRDIADTMERGREDFRTLRDINGNTVGTAKVTP